MFQTFRREPGFYRRLFLLALPMVLQNLITTSLGFADTFMVGLLGNAEMAAVTAANVPIFVMQIVVFGFQSGLAILVSQYWGRGDTGNINRCLGVALYAVTGFTALVSITMFLFPAQVLRLITPNQDLIDLGLSYIQIVGFSYIFTGISSIYAGVHRSTEYPFFGTVLFTISMCTNTFLNYVLIFGKFGAPAMGVTGAAVATLASRIVEFTAAILYALCNKRLPLQVKYVLCPGRRTLRSFMRYSLPVVCNETLWSIGLSMLTVIMGHMANSQDMLAAYALIGNIDKLATVVCFGLAAATAVIVGKEIGEGSSAEHVFSVSRTLLACSVLVGFFVMVVLLILRPTFFKPVLFPLFDLSEGAAYAAGCMSLLYALAMPLRAFDVTNITGVLRAGGDSKVAALIDVCPVWAAAIPLMAVAALVLNAPVFVVCLTMQAEQAVKCPIGYLRFRSRKWINDITRAES